MLRTRTLVTSAAVTCGLVLAACSSSHGGGASVSSSDSSSVSSASSAAPGASTVGGVQQITVKGGDNDRFSPSTISVHPGTVKLTLVNDGNGAPHNLQFPSLPSGDWVPLVQAGGSASVTFKTPAPGTYKFVCSLHEAAGMVGKLVVLPN